MNTNSSKQWHRPLIFLALVALIIVGVSAYVLLERLSDQVLTIIATVGCAAGVALPTLLVALVILLRRAENGTGRNPPSPLDGMQMTQPLMMVVPPMALPQTPSYFQPNALLDHQPVPRTFTIVGDER